MILNRIFLLVICFAFTVYCGISEKTFYLNSNEGKIEIETEPETLIHLKFKSKPSNGYAYYLETPAEDIITIQAQNLKPNSIGNFEVEVDKTTKKAKSTGYFYFTFLANQIGTQNLVISIRKPWENTSKSLFSIEINVNTKFERNDEDYFQDQWIKVQEKFKDNDEVLTSPTVDEFFYQDDIKYLLRMMTRDKIDKKPTPLEDKNLTDFVDPFMPPVEPKLLYDEEFTPYHRIIFSKYAAARTHLLIVTRNQTSQFTQLFPYDFAAAIKVMKIIDGYVFFNGGLAAGASQPHKHLQSIKYEYDRDYGIFKLVANETLITRNSSIQFENEKFYTINNFNFRHILIKFSDETTKRIKGINQVNNLEVGTYLYQIWVQGMRALNILDDTVRIIENQYSVFLTDNFLLIVPRSKYIVELENGKLSLNSASFGLSFLMRNTPLEDEMKKVTFLEILKMISVDY